VAVAAAAAWFPQAEIVGASVRAGAEGLPVAEIRAQLAAAGVDGSRLRPLLLEGHPAEQLIEAAKRERADLLTSGRRGHGPLRDLFVGSVAEKLLQLAPCPILLAH
jgi:nucleotide-binding universal stress UspA family protein